MIDLRYHITTLVAVFFALAIGILVGTTMVSDQVLVEQQKQMIDRLEQDFTTLREQNRASRQEMAVFQTTADNYRQFARQVYPLLVSGRLQGIHAALVSTTGSPVAQLQETLSFSGIEIDAQVIVNTDPKNADLLKAEAHVVAEKLAEFLTEGGGTEVIQRWSEAGLVSAKTGGKASRPDVVIIVGGAEREDIELIKGLDIPLIRSLKTKDMVVIGTEYVDKEFSYIPYYQMEGVSTIDNIDMLMGQTALTFLLEGRPGHYGVKPTAKAILPELQ